MPHTPSVDHARLLHLHRQLGPVGTVRIETARVNGSLEQLDVTVFWRYTLVIGDVQYSRRLELLEERSSRAHSLCDAIGQAIMDVETLEKDLACGVKLRIKEA